MCKESDTECCDAGEEWSLHSHSLLSSILTLGVTLFTHSFTSQCNVRTHARCTHTHTSPALSHSVSLSLHTASPATLLPCHTNSTITLPSKHNQRAS